MIGAKIVQRYRKLRRSIISFICTKFIIKCGDSVRFEEIPLMSYPHNIYIGSHTYIDRSVRLNANTSEKSITIGRDCIIMNGAVLKATNGKIIIGDYSSLNDLSRIVSYGDVKIGNYVRIGSFVSLVAGNHTFSDAETPIHKQGIKGKGIVVDDDVWIGNNAVILDGVSIGKGSIVGAGAVVTKNVKPFSIVAGVPAVEIARRKQ